MEVLAIAEDHQQATRRCTPHNTTTHVTLEAYSFDKERHEAWEVPCIQPSKSEGVIVVAAEVSLDYYHFSSNRHLC